MIEEAEREGTLRRLEPAPLSAADALALLGEDIEGSMGERLYRESGGNPFYLEQLRAATTQGVDAAESNEPIDEEAVPRAVKAAIAREIEALSDRARLLVQGAAVAGESIEPELAAQTGGVAAAEALEALDELVGGT